MAEINDKIVRHANMAVGYGYPHQYAYRLLYPNDPPGLAKIAAKTQSGCALTALAVWRAAGVVHASLSDPYLDNTGPARIGNAVSLVVKIAMDFGAWVDCRKYTPGIGMFGPGDVVLIGANNDPKYGGVEHVLIVTGVDADTDTNSWFVHSVDGGQPGILPRTRRAKIKDDALSLHSLTTAAWRRVQGWAVASKLARKNH